MAVRFSLLYNAPQHGRETKIERRNAMPRFKLLVEIILDADDEDQAMDLPHEIWGMGDLSNKTNATIWVKDLEEADAP